MQRFLIQSLLAVASLIPFAGTAAADILVTIQGSSQGKFQGDGTSRVSAGKIVASAFQYEVISPRDAASGQATGKRQHKPLVITKALGIASPQIFQALVNNEALVNVTLEFVRASSKGGQEVYYVIKLTNAFITGISQGTAGSGADTHELEHVSFTFQKIEVEDKIGKTVAQDSFNAGQ